MDTAWSDVCCVHSGSRHSLIKFKHLEDNKKQPWRLIIMVPNFLYILGPSPHWPSLSPRTARRKASWRRYRVRVWWWPWCGSESESSLRTKLEQNRQFLWKKVGSFYINLLWSSWPIETQLILMSNFLHNFLINADLRFWQPYDGGRVWWMKLVQNGNRKTALYQPFEALTSSMEGH